MTMASALAAADRTLLVQTGFRNKLINGNFDFWQRGVTQNTTGFGSDDRWANECSGSTIVHSQGEFDNDQTDVPGFPLFYSSTVVTSVAGAGNYARKVQRIEDVGTLAGRSAILTFWAKADAAKDIAIDFMHRWGLGLTSPFSPSKVTLTTSWAKYRVRVDVPPLTDTIGTGYRGSLHLRFWFDAGTTSDALTDTLGQQSGTFDLAQIQFEEGPIETPFEYRPRAVELALCQRYFEKTYEVTTDLGTAELNGALSDRQVTGASTAGSFCWRFAVSKFEGAAITITTYNPAAAASTVRNHTNSTDCTSGTAIAILNGRSGAYIPYTTAVGSAAGNLNIVHAAAEAEVV